MMSLRIPVGLLVIGLWFSGTNLRAQKPEGITFELAVKDDRKVFRIGEQIDVEFRFTAKTPGKYQVIQALGGKRYSYTSLNHFFAEPAVDVVDPLGDYPRDTFDLPNMGNVPSVFVLDQKPTILNLRLNEWLSIRKPGRYRITAESRAVGIVSPVLVLWNIGERMPKIRSEYFNLRSNAVEIDIVEPEAGWAEGVLSNAVAVLEAARVPRLNEDEQTARKVAAAGGALRFLGTRDAAHVLFRLMDAVPEVGFEIKLGAWSSPYRADIIKDIEERLTSPGNPVDRTWTDRLIELLVAEKVGPRPRGSLAAPDASWLNKVRSAYPQVAETTRDALLTMVERKPPAERAISITELLWPDIVRGDLNALELFRRHFLDLPNTSQDSYLRILPTVFRQTEWQPVLLTLASGQTSARDIATRYLYDVEPVVARGMVVDRIRSGSTEEALLWLPDKTLPELDDALAAAYEQGKPVDLMIARYATAAISQRVREVVEQHGSRCSPIVAYLFRVAPEYAAGRLSQNLHCVNSYRHVLMSDGLESALVRALTSSDATRRMEAAEMLDAAISEKPKRALLDLLRNAQSSPDRRDETETLRRTLLESSGWLLSSSDFDRVARSCSNDDGCRKSVRYLRKQLTAPLTISTSGDPFHLRAWVGPYEVSSLDGLKLKVSQFQKGTRFRFYEDDTTWLPYGSISAAVVNAGMKLIREEN